MTQTDWHAEHAQHFQNTPCLVTGGAGFIGSHLVEALARLGADVRVLDDLSGSDESNLVPARTYAPVPLIQASLLDADALGRACEGVRYVFHLAAKGSVPESVRDPRAYHDVNLTGTLNLLEASREAGVQRLVLASSAAVYGQSPELPKHEGMQPEPISPYAATKIAGEQMLQAYAHAYTLDTVSLRYFNVFGPRQNANSAYAAVIAAFADALASDARPAIYGDGEQTRDFVSVLSVAHANLLAARAEAPQLGAAYNVADGQAISVNQLAATMADAFGRPDLLPIHHDPRPGDILHSLADIQKITAALGYRPVCTFEQALRDTVHWYQQATT